MLFRSLTKPSQSYIRYIASNSSSGSIRTRSLHLPSIPKPTVSTPSSILFIYSTRSYQLSS